MKTVEWRDIPGYNGAYQVSNFGEVRSNNHLHKNYPLAHKVTKAGYHYVTLSTGRKFMPGAPRTKTVGIARAVAEAFIPNPNGYCEVDHINGDKSDNRVENLQWIEHDSNVRKSQAYYYRCWHVDNPDQVYEFNSRRQMELAVTEMLGLPNKINSTYNVKVKPGKPNKHGWVFQTDEIRGQHWKRFI